MDYKEKEKRVKMFQVSARNFDDLCKFLGYTPLTVENPVFDIDEYGNTRDSFLGVWVKHRPSEKNGDEFRVMLGDCIVCDEKGYYNAMSPWDFADKYVKI